MGRARLLHFRGLAAGLALVAACTASSGTVRGVVLEVEGSFTDVTAFTLLVEGERLRFVTMEDGDYEFPPAHLQEHVRTSDPVVVEWALVDGERQAVSIADG